MGAPKGHRVSSVTVPLNNINTYIRVQGYPPYPLSRALQEWDGVEVVSYWHKDSDTNTEKRLVREIQFLTESSQGQAVWHKVVVTEQIFEVALYTRASKRFADWMRANKEAVKAGSGA